MSATVTDLKTKPTDPLLDVLRTVQGVREVSVPPGHVLAHAGQSPNGLYVIREGSIKIELRSGTRKRDPTVFEFTADHRPILFPDPDKPVVGWSVTSLDRLDVFFIPWVVFQASHVLRRTLSEAAVHTVP